MKHTLVSRTVPPLMVALIIGCVWYALDDRPQAIIAAPPSSTSTVPASKVVVAQAEPVPAISPTVKKQGTELEFSVNPTPYVHIQKIEFYVEDQFMGAAYSTPYRVAVSENNLSAGQHTVTAKIYTTDTTAQSQPAMFVAKPTVLSTTPAEVPDTSGTTPPADTTPPPAALPAPDTVTANAASDGTSATLGWNGVEGAARYQVWRDGNQVATATGTGYTDTGLNPGQTYDYYIVAVTATGGVSDPSVTIAATMPAPQDTSPVNTATPQDTQAAQTPTVMSATSQVPDHSTDQSL